MIERFYAVSDCKLLTELTLQITPVSVVMLTKHLNISQSSTCLLLLLKVTTPIYNELLYYMLNVIHGIGNSNSDTACIIH